MSESGFYSPDDEDFGEPLTDDELLDPVEKRTIELLEATATQLEQSLHVLQALIQQNQQIIKLLSAERVTESVGRDGRNLHPDWQ
jgi:hypothetical protein